MDSSTIPPILRARRRLATVVVDGLGAVGLPLAEQLTELCIGTVILRDDSPVAVQDTGFRSIDRGRLRAEAAAELIGARAQQTAVLEAPGDAAVSGVDLHIVTGCGRLPVRWLKRAAAESPAVLPVVAARAGWRVGPLLLRDSPVCVECVEGTGLLGTDPESGGIPAPPAVLSAAAVAAQQAQVLVDGMHRCLMEQAALVARADTGWVGPVAVEPQADCRCLTRAGRPSGVGGRTPVGL